jgi:pilus assembly protein Flp/PilA
LWRTGGTLAPPPAHSRRRFNRCERNNTLSAEARGLNDRLRFVLGRFRGSGPAKSRTGLVASQTRKFFHVQQARTLFARFRKDEKGVTLVEYGIALVLAITVGAGALVTLGGGVSEQMTDSCAAFGAGATSC